MATATRAFFSERAYVVTGGTQGIGEAAAMALAKDGAGAIVIAGRNAENGRRVAAALEKTGAGAALFVAADLEKPGTAGGSSPSATSASGASTGWSTPPG